MIKSNKLAQYLPNNDSVIGELIEMQFQKVGTDGVITVEESKGIQTSMDIVEGMNSIKDIFHHVLLQSRKNEL